MLLDSNFKFLSDKINIKRQKEPSLSVTGWQSK